MKRYLLIIFISIGFANNLFPQGSSIPRGYSSPTYSSPTYSSPTYGQKRQNNRTIRQSNGTSGPASGKPYGTSGQSYGTSGPASGKQYGTSNQSYGTSGPASGKPYGTSGQSYGTSGPASGNPYGTSGQSYGISDPTYVNPQRLSPNSSQSVVQEVYTQNESRNEFNRLLNGIWKYENGSISVFENGFEKIKSISGSFANSGFCEGEIGSKDYRYIGKDVFECNSLIKEKRNNEVRQEWLRTKVTVFDDFLVFDFLGTTTTLWHNYNHSSIKMYLIERKAAYPPELVVELKPTSSSISSNSKIDLNYSIRNIGKVSANSVKITLSADKLPEGLYFHAKSFVDAFTIIINPNEIANGTFVIETNEKLKDGTVDLTLKVVTDDDYSTTQTISLTTRTPVVRGLPPDLFAELNFKDDNNNGILEALENATLYIKITNKGKGNAQDLKVRIEDNLTDNDLTIGDYFLKLLEPDNTISISIPIKAGLNIKTTQHRLKLKVAEYFGYDIDDAFLILNTFAYQPPKLIFSGLEIIDSGENTYAMKEDGLLQAGEQAKVKVVIQNIGQGDANNVNYIVTSTNQDIYVDKSIGSLENLKAGQAKEFTFIISPNKRVINTDKLPIFLTLKETIGRGNLINFQLPMSLNTRPPQAEILKVNSDFESLKKNIAKFEYNSNKFTMNTSNLIDIKTIVPSKITRKNSVAIIFGIEKYKELPPAPFASNDADLINEYFKKRLGIDKVVIYKDNEVSGFIFDDVFNPDNGELQKAIVKGQTDLFVYYSGHGIPNKSGDNIYLFPSDGKISRLETQGYSINRLYENLEKLGAKSVTVFLDACFSGGSRTSETIKTENLVAMKGVKIKPKIDGTYLNDPNFTVFNSSSGDETSLGFDAAETGLFTYFLCAGLQGKADLNNDKKITSGELKKYLFDNVSETSRKISGVQTPEFFGNENTILLEF